MSDNAERPEEEPRRPAVSVAETPGDEGQPSFHKPTLILKDPDRYAFANRIRRLTFVLAALCLLAASPYLLGQFQYHLRAAELRAGVDVASEALDGRAAPAIAETSKLVAMRIAPSVVSVQTPGYQSAEGQGSGVIVDSQGYIVSNFHVVREAVVRGVPPTVFLADGRNSSAQILGFDAATDLAVLKIDEPNLVAAEWGDSDELQVGDLVWAAGSPFGLDSTVTFGIVSAKARRSEDGVTDTAYQEYLQTDVAVNPGNSGGPLVNMQGKLVGINTAIVGPSYRGISFAIPASLAQRQYEKLRTVGWVERGYLGVTQTTVPEIKRLRLGLKRGEGVYVARTLKPGPANEAGIRPEDVILSWNGSPVGDPTLLQRVIASTEVGSTAKVIVKRFVGGQPAEIELEVRVGVRPLQGRPRPAR